MQNSRQSGFTMPELLVVGTVLIAIVISFLILVRPLSYAGIKRNAERRLHLAQLVLAIRKYESVHHTLPPHITQTESNIESGDQDNGLCEDLVPDFIKDIPKDPLAGSSLTPSACNSEEQVYVSGYTAQKTKDGEVILRAPEAEAGQKVEVRFRP